MAIRFERALVLGAIETTYGVDPTPAAAMQLREVTVDDVIGDGVNLDLVRTGMGGFAQALHGRRVNIKGKTYLASSGAAGTAPAWDWLARCTGHSKTVSAGTKVEYSPVDTGFESAAMYFNMEGNRTRILGARGNAIFRWEVGKFPEIEFDLVGLFDANASVAFPASPDFSAWRIPPLFNKTATTFTLATQSEVLESIEVNAGMQADYVERINRKDIEVGDRKPTISMSIEEPSYATRILQNDVGVPGTYKAIAMLHGTAAGAKVRLTVTNWQIQSFQRQKMGNNAGLKLGGGIVPASGTADYIISAE